MVKLLGHRQTVPFADSEINASGELSFESPALSESSSTSCCCCSICVYIRSHSQLAASPDRSSTAEALTDLACYDIESFACEWLEINRTLAQNALLVSELSLNLRGKEAMLAQCSKQWDKLTVSSSSRRASSCSSGSPGPSRNDSCCSKSSAYSAVSSTSFSSKSTSTSAAASGIVNNIDTVDELPSAPAPAATGISSITSASAEGATPSPVDYNHNHHQHRIELIRSEPRGGSLHSSASQTVAAAAAMAAAVVSAFHQKEEQKCQSEKRSLPHRPRQQAAYSWSATADESKPERHPNCQYRNRTFRLPLAAILSRAKANAKATAVAALRRTTRRRKKKAAATKRIDDSAHGNSIGSQLPDGPEVDDDEVTRALEKCAQIGCTRCATVDQLDSATAYGLGLEATDVGKGGYRAGLPAADRPPPPPPPLPKSPKPATTAVMHRLYQTGSFAAAGNSSSAQRPKATGSQRCRNSATTGGEYCTSTSTRNRTERALQRHFTSTANFSRGNSAAAVAAAAADAAEAAKTTAPRCATEADSHHYHSSASLILATQSVEASAAEGSAEEVPPSDTDGRAASGAGGGTEAGGVIATADSKIGWWGRWLSPGSRRRTSRLPSRLLHQLQNRLESSRRRRAAASASGLSAHKRPSTTSATSSPDDATGRHRVPYPGDRHHHGAIDSAADGISSSGGSVDSSLRRVESSTSSASTASTASSYRSRGYQSATTSCSSDDGCCSNLKCTAEPASLREASRAVGLTVRSESIAWRDSQQRRLPTEQPPVNSIVSAALSTRRACGPQLFGARTSERVVHAAAVEAGAGAGADATASALHRAPISAETAPKDEKDEAQSQHAPSAAALRVASALQSLEVPSFGAVLTSLVTVDPSARSTRCSCRSQSSQLQDQSGAHSFAHWLSTQLERSSSRADVNPRSPLLFSLSLSSSSIHLVPTSESNPSTCQPPASARAPPSSALTSTSQPAVPSIPPHPPPSPSRSLNHFSSSAPVPPRPFSPCDRHLLLGLSAPSTIAPRSPKPPPNSPPTLGRVDKSPSSSATAAAALSPSQVIFTRLRALTQLLLMSNNLEHIIEVSPLPASKSQHFAQKNRPAYFEENELSSPNWSSSSASLSELLPGFAAKLRPPETTRSLSVGGTREVLAHPAGGGQHQTTRGSAFEPVEVPHNMVKSTPPPPSSALVSNKPDSDAEMDLKSSKGRPQSPPQVPTKTKSNFSQIFRPVGFRNAKENNNLSPANLRRSDSPTQATVVRSTSSVGGSTAPPYSSSPPTTDQYLLHHRPSMPTTGLQKDLKQMEFFLAHHQAQLTAAVSQPEADSMSPTQKSPPEPTPDRLCPQSKASTMPHPSSTPSLTSVASGASPPSGSSYLSDGKSSSNAVTLRRPSSIGRLSNSFTGGGPGKGSQILKYSKKRLRGPYGEMLESKMRGSEGLTFDDGTSADSYYLANRNSVIGIYGQQAPAAGYDYDQPTTLSFTDELLRQTKNQRTRLDQNSKETIGTASPTEHRPEFPLCPQSPSSKESSPTKGPTIIEAASSAHPSTDIEEEDEDDDGEKGKRGGSTEQTLEPKEVVSGGTGPTVVVTEAQVVAGPSITEAIGRHLDTRAHIVGELYDTEKNYCEVLRTLHELYLFKYRPTTEDTRNGQPLASPKSVDVSASDLRWLEYIAFRLPMVMDYHGKLLEQLRRRIADWCPDTTRIGDLFHSFVNDEVIQFYETMVDHLNELSHILKAQYKQMEAAQAKEASASGKKDAGHARQSSKDSTSAATLAKKQSRRLAPDYLLISTIQRIPRYELLLQRLVKNTTEEHSDYQSLEQALSIIHDVLVKIGTYANEPGAADSSSGQSGTKDSFSEPTSVLPAGSSTEPSPVSATTAPVTLSSPQTAISVPVNLASTPTTPATATATTTFDTSSRQLYVRDLEPVVEGAQTALEQYAAMSPVHIYEYVMIRKRERVLFVLDDALLVCTVKNKKKSDKFEYNKFKMQQFIKLEAMELRCQCWQHWLQEAEKAAEKTSGNLGGNVSGSSLQSPSEPLLSSLATSSGCRACIETLEHDIKALLKLQTNVQEIATYAIRQSLSLNLTDIVQGVYTQLVEMHETVARCSKDCNVDLYLLSANTAAAANESLSHYPSEHCSPVHHSQHTDFTHHSTSLSYSQSNKSVRLVHYRCPRHQPSPLTGEPELTLTFTCAKKRSHFEMVVTGLRTQIIKSRLKLEFLRAIPYEKTRAGLQFTCASSALGTNNVWISKSDGFVGQISVLSIKSLDEPTVVSCNGVCNAQIVCMTTVPQHAAPIPPPPPPPPPFLFSLSHHHQSPASKLLEAHHARYAANSSATSSLFTSLGFGRSNSHRSSPLSHQTPVISSHSCADGVEETDASETESEQHSVTLKAPHQPVQSQTSPSKSPGSTIFSHLKPKASRTKSSPAASVPQSVPHSLPQSTAETRRPSPPTTLHAPSHRSSPPTAPPIDSEGQSGSAAANDGKLSISHDCPTMWFGTDDSTIYIYSCFDAVRIGKNKAKVTLNAKVDSIQYFKNRVFVGLANQTVAVFTRDASGFWQTTPSIVEGVHCTRFCVVHDEQLWTTSNNVIQIRDEELNPVEEAIHVDELEEIAFIVANQQAVFLASSNSSYIYRYSPFAPYQRLGTISIGPFVNKALALTEDIIRHHKNACLKVSAMHTVQDRIWIGTSAGVILVLDSKNTIEIIPNGHTGHVRFITSSRLQDGQVIVVSGGDGYEQFTPGTGSNLAGPTDLFHFMSYCSNLALNLLGRSSSNSNMATLGPSSLSTVSASTLPSAATSPIGSAVSPSSVTAGSLGTGVLRPASTLTPSLSSVSGTSSLSSASSGSSASYATVTSGCPLSPADGATAEATPPEATFAIDSNSNSAHTTSYLAGAGTDDSKSHLLIWKI